MQRLLLLLGCEADSAQPSESMSSTDFDDLLTYCEEHPDPKLIAGAMSLGQTLGLLPESMALIEACAVEFPFTAAALAAAAAGRAVELTAAGCVCSPSGGGGVSGDPLFPAGGGRPGGAGGAPSHSTTGSCCTEMAAMQGTAA